MKGTIHSVHDDPQVTTHHTSIVLTNKFTAPIIEDNTGQLKTKMFHSTIFHFSYL